MANSKANIYNIALNGPLETNQYKGGIKQYQGFNEKNAFYRNNALTPFWKKETTADSSNVVFDNDGNAYYIKNNALYKKDIAGNETLLKYLERFINTGFTQYFGLNHFKKTVLPKIDNLVYYYDENHYVKAESYFDLTTSQGAWTKFTTPTFSVLTFNVPTVMAGNARKFLWSSFSNRSWDYEYDYRNDRYILPCGIYSSTGSQLLDFEGADIIIDKVYYYLIHVKSIGEEGHESDSDCVKADSWYFVDKEDLTYTRVSADSVTYFIPNYTQRYKDSGSGYLGLGINPNKDAFNVVYYYENYTSGEIEKTTETLSEDAAEVKYLSKNTKNFGLGELAWLDRINNDSSYSYTYYDYLIGSYWFENGHYLSSSVSDMFDGGIAFNSWGGYAILVNSGSVSGISFNGVLLTDWFTIDETFKIVFNSSNNCIYRTNDGDLIQIERGTSVDADLLKIAENKIILNIDSIHNIYNLETGQLEIGNTDFNNRMYCSLNNLTGTSSTKYQGIDSFFSGEYSNDNYPRLSYVSSLNANYEITGGNPSILFNPIQYNGIRKDVDYIRVASDAPREIEYEGIDFYADSEYYGTFLINLSNTNYYFNAAKTELEGTTYPIDTSGNILYSPNIFTEYIESYINQDMVINGTTGYPLVYSNQKVVLGYYLLSEIENIDNIFVLQGQTYGIADNKIFSYSYSSGVISGINTICNITNYEFIGNTTSKAYFWNTVDKSIYVFTGANTLSLFSEGYEIGDIVVSAFDVTTDTVYIATASSVYLLNEQICELRIAGITKIYSWNKGFIFQNGTDVYFFSYVEADGFTAENVEIETCFYGAGDNVVTINDCLYLRLYSANSEEGTVTVTVTTVANEGITTEKTQLNIKSSDWDDKTNSVYLRYQPKKQRGLGSSFAISSPFAIAYMGVGATPDTLLVDKVSKGAVNSPAVVSSKLDF